MNLPITPCFRTRLGHFVCEVSGRLASALSLACLLAQPGIAAADEVGDKMFVVEPKARPVHVSESGKRYWRCEGLVAQRLIGILHSELSVIAREEGVPAPMELPCLYSIGVLRLAGQAIPMYSVDFYVSKASMESCLVRDFCTDFRSMNFMVKDGKLHRQYMVTNFDKRLTRMACVSMQGQVVKAKGGCQ